MAVIVGTQRELKILEELRHTKRRLEQLQHKVAKWWRSGDGDQHSTLLTESIKIKVHLDRGEEVTVPT